MSYFNYHAKAKHLIKSGNCLCVTIFKDYHNIKPAMVFYFTNSKPIPIRDYMWKNYLELITEYNIRINNPDNISLNEFI